MNLFPALLLIFPMVSVANTEQTLTLAETEVHSTAGIANRVHRRFERFDTDELTPDESSPYFEDDATREELDAPTTVKQRSPDKGKTLTRTTSRRTSQYRQQPVGVDIAPVVVPIYPGNGHHGSP